MAVRLLGFRCRRGWRVTKCTTQPLQHWTVELRELAKHASKSGPSSFSFVRRHRSAEEFVVSVTCSRQAMARLLPRRLPRRPPRLPRLRPTECSQQWHGPQCAKAQGVFPQSGLGCGLLWSSCSKPAHLMSQGFFGLVEETACRPHVGDTWDTSHMFAFMRHLCVTSRDASEALKVPRVCWPSCACIVVISCRLCLGGLEQDATILVANLPFTVPALARANSMCGHSFF